ncbi:MAG: hypothetical protein A2148_01230 [Chloroflexi bacterium RBG_16_68_14]|nr:MAG: hypothetical protein A2148_01230 [Chloroflexi bacterium RBG_16_68_14]
MTLRFRFATVLTGCGLAVAALLLASARPVLGQEPTATPTPTAEVPAATATISGVVFDDLDGDGARAPDEPGLPDKQLALRGSGAFARFGRTSADGSFLFDGLPPGQYSVGMLPSGGVALCAEYPVSFNPLEGSWCAGFTFQWHAVPGPVTLTIESGDTVEVAIGAQPADLAAIAGMAILGDDYAPPGTLIEALVGAQECGRTEVLTHQAFNFEFQILGERERAGCARMGDAVQFRVGGVPAAETYSYVPFARVPRLGYQIQHLVAMEDHAWYWSENFGAELLPPDGAAVQALVDGIVCGETTITIGRWSTAGFSKLIVPSEEIQPGCGRPGASVSFLVDGVEAEPPLPWVPGLQRIGQDAPQVLPGPTPTPTMPRLLPDTGSGPIRGSETASRLPGLVWVLLAAGAVALAGAAWWARRRRVSKLLASSLQPRAVETAELHRGSGFSPTATG